MGHTYSDILPSLLTKPGQKEKIVFFSAEYPCSGVTAINDMIAGSRELNSQGADHLISFHGCTRSNRLEGWVEVVGIVIG